MKSEKIKNISSNLGIKVFIGGIFLVFGLATLQYYIGIVFIIVSIIAFTYSTGIEIDLKKHEIRPYTKYLWIVKGRWIKLHNFKSMYIKKTRKGIRQYGGRTSVSTSRFYTYYDVFLNADNYYKNLLLFTSKDKNTSLGFAEKWSETLNVPLKK